MRLFTVALAIIAFGSVFAESAPTVAPSEDEKSSLDSVITRFDANKDGDLSAEEITATRIKKLIDELAVADTNKDGKLDKSEIAAARAVWKGKNPGEHVEK